MPIIMVCIELAIMLFTYSLLGIFFWGGNCDKRNLEDHKNVKTLRLYWDFLGRKAIDLISLISHINHLSPASILVLISLNSSWWVVWREDFLPFFHTMFVLKFFGKPDRLGYRRTIESLWVSTRVPLHQKSEKLNCESRADWKEN